MRFLFVGGDCYTGPKFAIDAIAAGKEAAISLHRYVHKGADLKIGRNRRDFHELDKSNLALGEYARAPRQSAALDAGVELRQIEARQQSPDHPILWNVPETDYLIFYLFQVV